MTQCKCCGHVDAPISKYWNTPALDDTEVAVCETCSNHMDAARIDCVSQFLDAYPARRELYERLNALKKESGTIKIRSLYGN